MIARDYFNKVANNKDDFLQIFIDRVDEKENAYCAIGGLAVSAYAEPVVSLDLDHRFL